MIIKKTNPHRQNPNNLTRSKVSYATGLLISSIIISMPLSATAGETIVYPGALLDVIVMLPDSLGPSGSSGGKSNSLLGNSVSVNNGGAVNGSVYAAINFNDTDELRDNQVFINSGGSVNNNVFGGHSLSANVKSNSVTLSGSQVNGEVYGGWSNSAVAFDNTVTLNNGSIVGGTVFGGSSFDGDAIDNRVTLNGGHALQAVYGGSSYLGVASGNSVTLNSGTIDTVYAGYSNSRDVIGNSATINGGRVDGFVFGGESWGGNVTSNSVTVSGGVIGLNVYGASSRTGNATSNTVTLNSGITVNGEVFGARSEDGDATGNTVTINEGTTLHSNVYGAWSNNGDATGNTITLSGGSIGGGVYGGFDGNTSSTNDVFTGNTLNIHAKDLSVGGDLKNFEYLNFYLPSTAVANTTMLTVGGEADLTDGAGRSSSVNLGIAGGSSPLKMGDTITLIDAGTLTTNSGLNTTADGQGMQGISLLYEFDIIADTANNKLLATVSSAPVVNPQTRVLSEGRIAGLAFVTQGTDILTGSAMQAKLNDATYGTSVFGLMQGSSVRHDTGSHVDVDGMNLVVGALKRNIFNIEHLTAGPFIEAGWGNYDSYNSFINAPFVHGDGDTNYYGVGLMGKLELPNDFYADASLRIGRVETDFQAYISGLPARYDSKSTYTSASIGGGKILNLDEQNSLDLYARYLWTRVGSDTQIVVGDRFNFEAMNSHRIRTGLRYTHDFKGTSSLYAGAAYEYELDGDAKASVHFQPLHTPSLQGGSGVFELGVSLKPQGNDRLSFDIGAQGYVGQREGVTGTVRINYAF